MLFRRTKIVATIGPASRSREVIQQMLAAGMNVARLNFSHGDYKDHAETIALLRQVANAEATPLTLLQDLQGPKIRVGKLPKGSIELVEGEQVHLVPLTEEKTQGIGIDYPYLAEEAQPGMQVLLDDGLLELAVEAVEGNRVTCRVVQGGTLKSGNAGGEGTAAAKANYSRVQLPQYSRDHSNPNAGEHDPQSPANTGRGQ